MCIRDRVKSSVEAAREMVGLDPELLSRSPFELSGGQLRRVAAVSYTHLDVYKRQPIGVIAIDSRFTPITKVNFQVEDTRVGQRTDYDKLTLEVWTDGSLRADEACLLYTSRCV